MNGFDLPGPPIPKIKAIWESAFDSLRSRIEQIQSRLDPEHEIGIVANGAGLILHVESVRLDGQIVVFSGEDQDGRTSWLLQHYTQLNVQIVSVPKNKPEARRIGF